MKGIALRLLAAWKALTSRHFLALFFHGNWAESISVGSKEVDDLADGIVANLNGKL